MHEVTQEAFQLQGFLEKEASTKTANTNEFQHQQTIPREGGHSKRHFMDSCEQTARMSLSPLPSHPGLSGRMRWIGSVATAGTEGAVMEIPLVEPGRDSARRGMVAEPSSLPAEAVIPAGSPTLCVSAMHLLESVEALALEGHWLTPTVGQNRLQTSLPNMTGSCPRHVEELRRLHGLWEMGGSGVQHLGAGASPGGVLIASHFGDLTQQLVEKHSWFVYEGRLQFSRLLQKHTHAFLLGWTPSSHVHSTLLLR